MSNTLDLIIPGLCGPLPELVGLEKDKNLSSVVSLLARAKKTPVKNMGYAEQLCILMGYAQEQIPFAELSLAGFGIDSGTQHWVHADPVHLKADLDHAVVYDSNSLHLDIEEAQSLVNDLNRHFSQDDIEFIMADANHWFLRSQRQLEVRTACLADVIMQNVNQFMPSGADEVFCKQLLNESQMLLHSNTANHKRETAGLLTANSVWLWGQGKINETAKSEVNKCFGNDILLRGLATTLNVKHEAIDYIEGVFTGFESDKRQLIVFSDLLTATNYGDVDTWLRDFTNLFEIYLRKLLDYARLNNIDINLYPCNGYRYLIDSKTKYRFWRRGNLEEYFEGNNKKT